MPSFMVAVKTKSQTSQWAHNGLRFPTRTDACLYAASLSKRWLHLTATEVQPSSDAPNAAFPVPSDRYPIPRA